MGKKVIKEEKDFVIEATSSGAAQREIG